MFGLGASKIIDTTSQKGADKISADAGSAVLKAATVINTTDAATFSAIATGLSPADLVKSIKAAQPAWTKDNREAFEPYVKQVLTGIKNIRGQVDLPKQALGKAQQDFADVQGKAIIPLNGAQSEVARVQNSLGPIADAANRRLQQAQVNLRSTLRSGADNAQNTLVGAGSIASDMRSSLGTLSQADVEGALVNIEGANNTIIDAANRVSQNGANLSGAASATLQVFPDAGVQDVGNTIVGIGNGVSTDAGATLTNAAGIQQGIANIRNTHAVIQQNAASIDGDLSLAQQNLAFAADALSANPDANTVLMHSRAVATTGDEASTNALMGDFAGKNPGAVMDALDNATNATRNAQGKLGSLDAGVLNNDLATMDQTASVMSQTGNNMANGSNSIRPTLSGIQTTDPTLQGAIDSMGMTADALSSDAGTIASQAPMLETSSVRALGDDINQATNAVANGSNTLVTTIDQARSSLMTMPSAASVKGGATELVTAFDGNTAAYQNLATALVTPQKNLADATATYAATIAPSQTIVDAASSALNQVTVPLGDLVRHAKGLSDSVGGVDRTIWNNPMAFWDKNKVDVEAVLKRNIADILGPQGL
jgi:hypothetical protein